MTLEEAIRRNQLELDGNPSLTDIKLRKSMALGNEAMKRIKRLRGYPHWEKAEMMSGETEE